LIVVGAILYVVGTSSGASASSAMVVPTAGASHAGIAVQGAF
jgi:hypothetical protein